MPTPITRARSTSASSRTWSTNSAAAVSPCSAEWSTLSSRHVSARTACERSETATRRWRWPKSTPTARPADGLSETITGGRPAWVESGLSPSRSPASPVSSRSETIVETVERESPVIRARSARLATPRSRRASITRLRLPSLREANEPLFLLTARALVSHPRLFVNPLSKWLAFQHLFCARLVEYPTGRLVSLTTSSGDAYDRGAVDAGGTAMKMRAAVLEEFGEPLVVQEVELTDPKAGEVLVRLVACGVCHTDLYTASGVDPSGYAPTVLGHEGAGVVEAVGAGVRLVAAGDHVVTLFSPAVRRVRPLPSTSAPTSASRSASSRTRATCPTGPPGCSRDGEEIRHFMGTSTFAEYTVMPEIALAKVDPEAPLDRACLFACGLSTGLGAAINTAKVRAGLDLRRLRRRDGRPRRGRRLPAAGRRADRLRRPLRGPARARPGPGRDRDDDRRRGRGRADRRGDRRLRRRLHLRGDRQRRGDAPGGRGGADGLGPLHGRRASPARARRSTSSRAS